MLCAICLESDSFAKDYNLVFNVNKCKWLLFGQTGPCFNKVDFHVGGKHLEQVHLGHIISDECNDASDIPNRKHSLCGQINNVICYFSNRNSVVKQSLMNAYCSSLYDCELWNLSYSDVQNVCTAWKMGLRRIWGLPYDSHSNLLPLLSDSLPIFDLIYLRWVNFLQKCVSHDSSVVNFISFLGIFHGRSISPIDRNLILL